MLSLVDLDCLVCTLQIREDIKKGVYVENLKEVEVTSARDVIQQLIQVYFHLYYICSLILVCSPVVVSYNWYLIVLKIFGEY